MELQEMRPAYVRFERRPIEDKPASIAAGHYVAKDVDFAIITPHYTKDVIPKKVSDWFPQMENDVRNERMPQKWLDDYRAAYEAWKRGQELPLQGTPIKSWGVISPAQAETLIRMNIRTVEDLAGVNDDGIRQIGMGGVDLKLKAKAWLSQLDDKGPLTQEIAQVKARNRELETSVETLTAQVKALMEVAKIKSDSDSSYKPFSVDASEGTVNVIKASDIIDEDPREAYKRKYGKYPHSRINPEKLAAALKD